AVYAQETAFKDFNVMNQQGSMKDMLDFICA
ncbi:CRISPR-associated protein, partial [Salmonella enterica subsp. enterica]